MSRLLLIPEFKGLGENMGLTICFDMGSGLFKKSLVDFLSPDFKSRFLIGDSAVAQLVFEVELRNGINPGLFS